MTLDMKQAKRGHQAEDYHDLQSRFVERVIVSNASPIFNHIL